MGGVVDLTPTSASFPEEANLMSFDSSKMQIHQLSPSQHEHNKHKIMFRAETLCSVQLYPTAGCLDQVHIGQLAFADRKSIGGQLLLGKMSFRSMVRGLRAWQSGNDGMMLYLWACEQYFSGRSRLLESRIREVVRRSGRPVCVLARQNVQCQRNRTFFLLHKV